MKTLLFVLLVWVCGAAQAATHYIRDGGSGSGTSWSDALDALPATLTRGDTYYIADGTYAGYTFDDNASGTSAITIKKCTAADHGTETGYSSTYCDGKATFTGTLHFTRPYYVIDGGYRNESNWKDSAAYGFSVQSFRASRLDGGHSPSGECSADNIDVRYTHVGSSSTSYAGVYDGEGFYLAGFGDSGAITCDNWTIHRSLIQNVVVGIQCAGCTGLTVEYSQFYIGWGKEAIRGQLDAKNMTVRWSVFEDSCMTRPSTTDRCTAEIAAWGYGPTGNYDDFKIYGNVFLKTRNFVGTHSDTPYNSQGVILIGGDGVNQSGDNVPARNALLYNNTTAGHLNAGNFVLSGTGQTGNVCRNNVWFDDAGSGIAGTCTSSNNATLTGTPFADYDGADLHLAAATSAGTTLSSPYDTDMDGETRGADGTWDLGAYEYDAGGSAPGAPSNFRLTSWAGWVLLAGLLAGFMGRMRDASDGNSGGAAAARRRLGRVGRAQGGQLAG